MKDLLIVKKYAKSVVEIITEDDFDACLRDAKILKELFAEQAKLVTILDTRLVSREQKSEFISAIKPGLQFADMWEKLFYLLIHNDRFHQIINILREIEQQIYHKQNSLIVKLKLARKQDKATTTKIITYLEKIFQKKVLAEIEYEPELLGGFYAETDNMIVDSSLQNNLKIFVTKKQQNRNK